MTGVMELLIPLVAVVTGLLVGVWRTWAASRRRASVRAGGVAHCRARLAVDGGRLERGRLTMSSDVLAWHGRGSASVDLAAARVLSAVVEPRFRQARGDDAALHLALPSGERAHLVLHHDDAGMVVRLLQDQMVPQEPAAVASPPCRQRGRVWPRLCLGVAAAWVVGWLAGADRADGGGHRPPRR